MPTTQFPAQIELSSLGSNGLILNGVAINDNSGIAVSSAGDINNDGITDFIIGADFADPDGRTDAGCSYVIFGSSDIGAVGSLELSNLNGSDGFVLNGVSAGEQSGYFVSPAGDINNDGVDDLIIGASYASPAGRTNAGRSYVVFGRAGIGDGGVLELSSLNGTNGFMLNGVAANDFTGRSVSFAGDINHDGIDDLLIGAHGAAPGGRVNAGKAYVVFGKSGIGASGVLELSNLNGSNGFTLNGVASNDYTGFSASAAGDINHDGINDILIGAHGADSSGRPDAGRSYVVFGGPSVGASGALELSGLNGKNGFSLNGIAANEYSGMSVSAAGDVNNDGADDLLISGVGAGRSYIVFGGAGVGASGVIELSSLNGSNGLILNGDSTSDGIGRCVSLAGDINQDGVKDIIVGAYGASPGGRASAGSSYAILGNSNLGATGNMQLSALNGDNGFTLNGVISGDYSGLGVSYAGDINNDGIGDFLIGAPFASPGGRTGAGSSYLVFGDMPPQLLTNQLVINQGQTLILSRQNLNATDNRPPTFSISDVKQGRFELTSKPGQAITAFSQAQVDASQVQFVHDGTSYAPAYQVFMPNSGIALSPPAQAAKVTFHSAPRLQHYVLDMSDFKKNQKRMLLSEDNFLSEDDQVGVGPRQLRYWLSQVTNGYFSYYADWDTPVTSFTQFDINGGDIYFTPTPNKKNPSFMVSVDNGWLNCTGCPVPGEVDSSNGNNNTLVGIILGSILGPLGATALAAGLAFLKYRIQKAWKDYYDLPNDGVKDEIAKKILSSLWIGCFGIITGPTRHQHKQCVQDVDNIILKVDRETGRPLLVLLEEGKELSRLSDREKEAIKSEFAKQAKAVVGSGSWCCRFFRSCCRSEAEALSDEENADRIAGRVRLALPPQFFPSIEDHYSLLEGDGERKGNSEGSRDVALVGM